MPVTKRVIAWLFLLGSFTVMAEAACMTGDTVTRYLIRSISLEGNDQTRPRIISRELTLHEGDILDSAGLAAALVKSRENLFNTSLFNVVKIDTTCGEGLPRVVDVGVKVIERWYIWPIPWLEFPDRNINAWLKDPLFSHLTYGVNLTFFNARGRNETLTLLLHFGYNQKYGFTYKTPYINRKQTWGFGFGADAELNRTLVVANEENRNVYYDVETGFLQQRYMAYAQVFYRPAWYLYHDLSVSYSHYIFADTLRSVEGFFTGDTSLDHDLFSLAYKIKYDRRDEKYYPLAGYYADFEFLQQGFPGRTEYITACKAALKGFWRLGRRWYWASGATGRCSFPQEQPFYLQQGLGYGRDFLRGYDSYIIPGQHFVISKNNLKFAILPQRTIRLSFIETPKFAVVPMALYLNLFTDFGYVWNRSEMQSGANSLTNAFLLGYGLELDFATYYDVVIGAGFSMNIQGTPGVFLHFIAPI